MPQLLAALLLLTQGAAAQARAAGGPDDLAQALALRLADFEVRFKAGQPPRAKSELVSDAELTAYLNRLSRLPKSLSDVEVRFERERIAARGLLDLDQLQAALSGGASLGGLAFLSGRVNVSVKGRLETEDGFGTFHPEEIMLGSIPLAAKVLEQIVAGATRSAENPEGIDILAPFRYPYAIRNVRLSPGRATVEF